MKPATVRTLWLLYAGFILFGATIPFHLTAATGPIFQRWHHLPGRDISIPDIVQNVLLFLPFGALGVAATAGRWRWTWLRVAVVSLLGAFFSLAVEIIQLFTTDRTASTLDVLTNSAGTLIGGLAILAGGRFAMLGLQRLHREGLAGVPELRPVIAASLVLAVAFLQPFDVTLDLSTIAGHFRLFTEDPIQFTSLRDEGMVVLVASLFAMALASYFRAGGAQGPGRKAAALGIGVILILESSQVVIGSRMPGLWDAAVGSAGVLCGAGIWTISRRTDSPGLWKGGLIALTVLAAGVQMLSPFELAAEYRGFSWSPFLGYSTRTALETLSHVLEVTLCYFPLGFCLRLGIPSRRRAALTAVLVTLVIAGPIEYLQGWVVGRYPDVTDVGLSVLGAWAGVMAARTDLSVGSLGRDKSRLFDRQ